MKELKFLKKPGILPPLDNNFIPVSIFNKSFLEAVSKSDKKVEIAIAIERENGNISSYRTVIFEHNDETEKANLLYIDRLVKSLLWIRGGWRIIFGGPSYIGEYISNAYSSEGSRKFDSEFMSRVYDSEFTVEVTEFINVPGTAETFEYIGGHLDGCRIGFDAGGSDRKVSAVIDGKTVFSEEVTWHPKLNSDPEYHYNEILSAMKTAAAHMPRLDAIGVSSAGIYIDNLTKVASLFIKVPEKEFKEKIRELFLNISREMGGVPIKVANDGDVTALAGAMSLNVSSILGIAMGTSEASGYIERNGKITGWINETAFVPVDLNPSAAVDEWAGDYGCGVKYFSQDAVIRLAAAAGINLDENFTPAEKLKVVQDLLNKGDERAEKIFESIGVYLGYGIAHYSDFYDIRHILVLGRVTSGRGGSIITDKANMVLKKDFPNIYEKITIHLPDESSRRVGQSIAAASLPTLSQGVE